MLQCKTHLWVASPARSSFCPKATNVKEIERVTAGLATSRTKAGREALLCSPAARFPKKSRGGQTGGRWFVRYNSLSILSITTAPFPPLSFPSSPHPFALFLLPPRPARPPSTGSGHSRIRCGSSWIDLTLFQALPVPVPPTIVSFGLPTRRASFD